MRNECYHNCGKKSGPCSSVCGQSPSLSGLTKRLDGHCCSKNIVDSPECPLSAVQSVEYDGFICMTLQRLVARIFQNVTFKSFIFKPFYISALQMKMLPQSSVQQEVQAHRPTTRLTRQMQRLSQRSDLFRKLNPYQLHIPTNMDAKD